MNILKIENHGPLIQSSNFWDTEAALHGRLYLSINAGCARLLVPDNQRAIISDMRPGAKYMVISMLPSEQWKEGEFAAEWMVEDGSDCPWSCHLSPGQIDRFPGGEAVGKEWVAAVWDRKKNQPHKCIERPAYFQIVPTLPWLKKIQ